MFPYFLTVDNDTNEKVLTIVIDGTQKMVKGGPVDKVVEAIKAGDEKEVKQLVDIATAIKKQSKGLFEVRNGNVYVGKDKLPNSLGEKIRLFYEQNLPYEPLIKFWQRLSKNPSYRSVNCLYDFLENNSVPITEDGCFIAYKGVRDNFKDCHSGKIDNFPGQTVSVPRNQVDDNPEQTCSYGLHVAGWNYASGTAYGGAARYLEIKIDPEHVVAVPADYNFQKMRVCQYYVVKEVTEKPANIMLARGSEYVPDQYTDEDDADDDHYIDEYSDEDEDEEDWYDNDDDDVYHNHD